MRTMMFVSVKVVSVWSGLTPLELLSQAVFFCIFTILCTLKLEHALGWQHFSWQVVFVPLLVGQAVNAYFVTIVLVRSFMTGEMKRRAVSHVAWTYALLTGITLSLVWVSRKLDNELDWSYYALFTPIYLLMMIRGICNR